MAARPLRPGYRTLSAEARVRLEERRSVFIGVAAPAYDEPEAAGLLARIRAEFPDASHHVSAWIMAFGRLVVARLQRRVGEKGNERRYLLA